MTLQLVIFYVFAVIAALGALSILWTRNVFYGAIGLIIALIAVAGVFVFSQAEFVAVSQLLVYAGGILVVMVFAIMLTSRIAGRPLAVGGGRWASGIMTGLVVLGALSYYLLKEPFTPNGTKDLGQTDSVPRLGVSLMTDFVLPLEISGVLLLVALLGAAVIISSIKSTQS
ncbi:MAG: NADH-ubiquinone/plastoquinone oxidoreductase chain 6 [Bacteroidia bacterium]|nr:NADH-ubiquinone/plastoquinone oxidoreductase chain 6 [Bacteroidia bacterium]